MSLVRSHTFLVAKLHSNGGQQRSLVPVPTLSFFSTRRPSRMVIVAAAQPHKLCLITESTNNLLRRSPTLRHGRPWTLSTPLSSLHASLLRTPCRALLQQGVSASHAWEGGHLGCVWTCYYCTKMSVLTAPASCVMKLVPQPKTQKFIHRGRVRGTSREPLI